MIHNMIYVKINEMFYEAIINGNIVDTEWDNRESKSITLKMDYAEAVALFVNDIKWSIVMQDRALIYQTDENGDFVFNENGEPILIDSVIQEEEFDNSDYSLAGDITDHRDGTITVKMGKLTDLEEAYELLLGGTE